MSGNAPTLRCPNCFSEKGSTPICPQCQYDARYAEAYSRIPVHTVLNNQYLLGRMLGKPGGFGMTYLAFDLNLNVKVAIKEFFPQNLVLRGADRMQVIADSPENAQIFQDGLAGFLKEARTLAQFDHANVVRVRNYFEANGSAYLVMDFYDGLNLSEVMERRGVFAQDEAIRLMMPILDGLRMVHQHGILHRDIKPENIYLANGNRPILLDFGAARAAVGFKSQNMTMVLTPGFAPFEQYASTGHQGPFTDVYACAATLYYMTTGRIPPEATARMETDTLISPDAIVPGLNQSFCRVVAHGLSVRSENRPATVQAFQDALLQVSSSYKPEPIPVSTEADRLITCPHCDAINKIPIGASLEQARCGACESLLIPRPNVVVACPVCRTLNRIPSDWRLHEAQCGKCFATLGSA